LKEKLNSYALGILKAGYNTREIDPLNPGYSLNDILILQTTEKGFYQGMPGLFAVEIKPEEFPETTINRKIRNLTGKQVHRVRYELLALEQIYSGKEIEEQNINIVYSGRISTSLKKGTTITPIKFRNLFNKRNQIYPGHYPIIEEILLKKHTTKPAKLEIIINKRETRSKVNVESTT